MSNKRSEVGKPSAISELFTWWSAEYGSDDSLAQILEVPRQTVWRWRTGEIQSMRPSDRREVARLLRINLDTMRQFLDGEISLEVLKTRQGERSVPLQELLTEIEGRPANELVAVNLHVATLLANVTQEFSSLDPKKNPLSPIPDTLGKIARYGEIVIHLETFKEARRLKNLIKAAQNHLGLSRGEYLQLVSSGDEEAFNRAMLLYADVMDETLRSHAAQTYELFCPHLFCLIEWQGRDADQPRVDYCRTYPDLDALLNDLKNSDQKVAVR